jgi:hypothetical protein
MQQVLKAQGRRRQIRHGYSPWYAVLVVTQDYISMAALAVLSAHRVVDLLAADNSPGPGIE